MGLKIINTPEARREDPDTPEIRRYAQNKPTWSKNWGLKINTPEGRRKAHNLYSLTITYLRLGDRLIKNIDLKEEERLNYIKRKK